MSLLLVGEVGDLFLLDAADLENGLAVAREGLQSSLLTSVEDDTDQPVSAAQQHAGTVADKHGDKSPRVAGSLVGPEGLGPCDCTTAVAKVVEAVRDGLLGAAGGVGLDAGDHDDVGGKVEVLEVEADKLGGGVRVRGRVGDDGPDQRDHQRDDGKQTTSVLPAGG